MTTKEAIKINQLKSLDALLAKCSIEKRQIGICVFPTKNLVRYVVSLRDYVVDSIRKIMFHEKLKYNITRANMESPETIAVLKTLLIQDNQNFKFIEMEYSPHCDCAKYYFELQEESEGKKFWGEYIYVIFAEDLYEEE